MGTKNIARTAMEGGHHKNANTLFRLHRRRERLLAKAYCRNLDEVDNDTIPEARRTKHWLWWDDIHSHCWRKILNPFFLAHANRPVAEAVNKLERRHNSDSYKDRMLRKEAREYVESASKYDWYDFRVDENGVIRVNNPF